MSNSTQMDRVLEGMLNFNAETKETLDSIKETIDKVFDKHYQANHAPYVVTSFEDETHYWEEQLANTINAEYFDNIEEISLTGVELLKNLSYVIIRGNLKSGNTIHFDNTKFHQLYINGVQYTGDYTFNGETSKTYERLTIVVSQVPYNVTDRFWGHLIINTSDFPIENAEIFINIGKTSKVQPDIEELLVSPIAESLYVIGSFLWKLTEPTSIKTLSVTENFSLLGDCTFKAPCLVNYFIPNSADVITPMSNIMITNIDISNCHNIRGSAFYGSQISGDLYINITGAAEGNIFLGSKKLTSVTIGPRVQTLGYEAFGSCIGITEFIIGDGVRSVGQLVGSKCESLVHIHFGKSLITSNAIHNSCFNVTSLRTISVSEGYRCAVTPINNTNQLNLDWRCFVDVLKNCAAPGEYERPSTSISSDVKFRVHADVLKAYNAALVYEGDDEDMLRDKEIAQQIADLMLSKQVSITT